MIVYHGTNEPDSILAEGFRLDVKHRSDPGDFGLGVYTTTEGRGPRDRPGV